MKAILDILVATHGGDTTDEFEQVVSDWIASARHPRTGRLYTEMVYQPMLELLDICGRTAFGPTLSPEAASSSCGPGLRMCTASHPSR